MSGLIGIGGGIVIVPALVFLFGMSQHLAQGTTLALLVPPVGILAALTYYNQGYVDLKAAGLICAGLFTGGWLGGEDRREPVGCNVGAYLRSYSVYCFVEDDVCEVMKAGSPRVEIPCP